MTRPNFEGLTSRECGEHRTVGPQRAWCFDCKEWCYAGDGCKGCRLSEDTTLFESTRRCVAWLNSVNPPTREEFGLRVLKIAEEAGEAAQAWIGWVGQNPRKGVTHTEADVCKELVDVVLTAMVALESISGDSRTILHNRLEEVENRIAATPKCRGAS